MFKGIKVGDTVYFDGKHVGSVRHDNDMSSAVVEKIGRKYFYVKDYSNLRKFHLDNGYESCESNYHLQAYRTKQEMLDEKERLKIINFLAHMGSLEYRNFKLATLRKIQTLIDNEKT